MVSWPAEMIRISSDLQILEKLHLLDIYDNKNQHRLSDTETLKIARHDQSIFAPCLLASSHSMAPRGNETKARAWDGTVAQKKRVAPKASSCLIHLGCLMTFHAVFQDIFGFILLSPFQSFDLVHPWSTPFILILSPFFD